MPIETKQINLQVAGSPDEFMFNDAVEAYQDTMDGFVFNNREMLLRPTNFDDFMKDLEELVGTLDVYSYDKNNNSVFRKYTNDEVRCYVSGNTAELYANILCKSEVQNHAIWTAYKKYAPFQNEVDIYSHSYFMSRGDLDEISKTLKPKTLDYISTKYYPYIDTSMMFDQFFTGSENILLLVGNPGLGKSKMATLAIKHAFENTDKLPYDKYLENPSLDNQFITVVFVKSTEVLAEDKFWRRLEANKADFVIIDDLDFMLTKRDSEVVSAEDKKKNDFLNQFLSYTDGVERYNTKFIITTNQKYDDIDTALLRKGRLFDILELRSLNKEEALEIWNDNDLEVSIFHELFKSDNVLPAELGSEINKRLNDRISDTTSSYIKEDGISKTEKAGRKKTMGL